MTTLEKNIAAIVSEMWKQTAILDSISERLEKQFADWEKCQAADDPMHQELRECERMLNGTGRSELQQHTETLNSIARNL